VVKKREAKSVTVPSVGIAYWKAVQAFSLGLISLEAVQNYQLEAG
jgi:hypothetical protein